MATHVYTASTAWAAALVTSVQRDVLKNLRAQLVWADMQWADQGTFNQGSDTIMWTKYPDLSITTPLTAIVEGTVPDELAITMTSVSISAAQYADLVGLTDLARTKQVHDVLAIATERVTRTAREVIDQVTRDAIFTGGTPAYCIGSASNTVRTDIGSTEYAVGADLIKLRAVMLKNKVPLPADGLYRLFVNPAVMYDLQRDTTAANSWLDINKYSRPGEIMKGEVGTYHGFRIIAVNNAPTFSSTTTVYASLAVGDIKGWGVGDLQTFRTYHTPPGGQSDPVHQHEFIGWKVSFGAAPLNNGYYYRFESAASSI
jgi:N4-gp56 family major capsid protein